MIRPRNLSGTTSCRVVLQLAMNTICASPVRARRSAAAQKLPDHRQGQREHRTTAAAPMSRAQGGSALPHRGQHQRPDDRPCAKGGHQKAEAVGPFVEDLSREEGHEDVMVDDEEAHAEEQAQDECHERRPDGVAEACRDILSDRGAFPLARQALGPHRRQGEDHRHEAQPVQPEGRGRHRTGPPGGRRRRAPPCVRR